MKLFRVEQWYVPEYGKSQLEMEKYFLANSQETVEAVVRERYGVSHWVEWGEAEIQITINEVEVTIL